MGMTPEAEVEILNLKLRIAELELALERANKGMIYVPATPRYPDPLFDLPYSITCDGTGK